MDEYLLEANELRIQAEVEQAIEHARHGAPHLIPNGTCHNPRCGDDVVEGKVYCDGKCAKEHAFLIKQSKQLGV